MKPGSSSEGFTLIEVLVALALLSITVTLIVQLFSSSLRSMASTEGHVEAARRAELRMKELLDTTPLQEGTWTETTDEKYRMKVTVSETLKERTDYVYLRLVQIDLSVSWKDGAREKTWTMRTLKTTDKTASVQEAAANPGK